jgi:hypothetical protein
VGSFVGARESGEMRALCVARFARACLAVRLHRHAAVVEAGAGLDAQEDAHSGGSGGASRGAHRVRAADRGVAARVGAAGVMLVAAGVAIGVV